MNKAKYIFTTWTNFRFANITLGAFVVMLLFVSQSCSSSDDNNDGLPVGGGEEQAYNFRMNLKALPDDLINNSRLYVFQSTGTNNFKYEQFNINKSGMQLKTQMEAGTWNLALLSCNTNVSANVTEPNSGNITSASSIMWKTGTYTKDSKTFLHQMPEEFRLALMPAQLVNANVDNPTVHTDLHRASTKVEVILKEHNGFGAVAPGLSTTAYVELLDVPSTLNWRGEFLPSKNLPAKGDMRKYITFGAAEKAETTTFFLPAHRGSDSFSASAPTDVSTHEIKLRICMNLSNGNPFFGKSEHGILIRDAANKPIPLIPNRIIRVTITKFSGEPETGLDIKVTVKDWEDGGEQNVDFPPIP